MIKYDKKNKKISVPSGLGNLKVIVNEYVEYPEVMPFPDLGEITITENGEYSGAYNKVIVKVPDLNGSYDDGYNDGINTQKSKLTSITITDDGEFTSEDGYNKIIANFKPKLDGVKFGNSTFQKLPYYIDLENLYYGDGMFENCTKLNSSNSTLYDGEWVMPKLQYGKRMFANSGILARVHTFVTAKNLQDAEEMFRGCYSRTEIASLNMTPVNCNGMFRDCQFENTDGYPIYVNTSNAQTIQGIFNNTNIDKVYELDCTNILPAGITGYFYENYGSQFDPFGYYDCPNLIEIGGFKNLKLTMELYRKNMPNLSYQSLVNIVSKVYNFKENGETPDFFMYGMLYFSGWEDYLDETQITELGEIATSRGWQLNIS